MHRLKKVTNGLKKLIFITIISKFKLSCEDC